MPELSPEDIRGSDVLAGRDYSAAGFRRSARSISLMPTTASMVPNRVTPIGRITKANHCRSVMANGPPLAITDGNQGARDHRAWP
jgi:hypothetical protein